MRQYIDIISEGPQSSADASGNKNSWRRGETAYFEYHCYMGHDSCDAEIWYRSHQPVTVLGVDHPGVGKTARQRINAGEPRLYKVRWKDGHEYVIYEDELYVDPSYFVDAANPPSDTEIAKARAEKLAKRS